MEYISGLKGTQEERQMRITRRTSIISTCGRLYDILLVRKWQVMQTDVDVPANIWVDGNRENEVLLLAALVATF